MKNKIITKVLNVKNGSNYWGKEKNLLNAWVRNSKILQSFTNVNISASVLSCDLLFAAPWTVACQAPPSVGFSRQEYWSRLFFPSPGDLLGPGIKPTSHVSPALAGGFFTIEPPGKPLTSHIGLQKPTCGFSPVVSPFYTVKYWSHLNLKYYLSIFWLTSVYVFKRNFPNHLSFSSIHRFTSKY